MAWLITDRCTGCGMRWMWGCDRRHTNSGCWSGRCRSQWIHRCCGWWLGCCSPTPTCSDRPLQRWQNRPWYRPPEGSTLVIRTHEVTVGHLQDNLESIWSAWWVTLCFKLQWRCPSSITFWFAVKGLWPWRLGYMSHVTPKVNVDFFLMYVSYITLHNFHALT